MIQNMVQELLKEHKFDVVITDLKMPKMSGIQILEAVKEKSEETAVIIMTAYGTIESAIEATRKGAFDYITKPFTYDELINSINTQFKKGLKY